MFGSVISAAEALEYYHLSARPADLPTSPIPTGFNALFRQCARVTRLRHPITHYSQYWNINQLSIDYPLRVCLRPRLTLS
jgi:hypothetical protein